MINDTRISEYKNLAYIMYASYPFIECNLKIVHSTNPNKYKFNVTEIYLQSRNIISNIHTILLTNTSTKYPDFCSNYCLLNSPTPLYFSKNTSSTNTPVLKKTFWWREDQTGGTANLFNYTSNYITNDNNTNLNIHINIKYYNVCTTYQTFSGDFNCQE